MEHSRGLALANIWIFSKDLNIVNDIRYLYCHPQTLLCNYILIVQV